MANYSTTFSTDGFSSLTTFTENSPDIGNVTAKPVMYVTAYSAIANTNSYLVNSTLIPALIYTFIMMFMGAPGNALVFYVYLWKWKKSTARIFILALAIFDMINCFLTIPMEITFTFRFIMFDVPWICKMSRFMTFWMNNCSSFTLVGIVFDRYWRICKPLQPQMTSMQAKRSVFFAVLFGLVASWPALVVYGTQTIPIPIKAKNIVIVGKACIIEDKFGTNDMKKYPLAFTIVLLVGNVIIDIAFVVAYIMIGLQVLKHGDFNKEYAKRLKWRKGSTSSTTEEDEDTKSRSGSSMLSRLSGNSREGSHKVTHKTDTLELKDKRANFMKQRSISVGSQSKTANERRMRAQRTTFMLFLVTLLFVISFIPYCVIVIIRYISPTYYFSLSNAGKAVYNVFLRSYLLSSAINPIIYSFVNEKFRKECKKALKALACRK